MGKRREASWRECYGGRLEQCGMAAAESRANARAVDALCWEYPATKCDALMRLRKQFRFAISPYYFSLIDREDPSDPIRRMIIPSSVEETGEGSVDPLSEQDDQVAPGLIHRYPDRVLFVVTSFCSSYCRFCIRKRNWDVSDAASSPMKLIKQ